MNYIFWLFASQLRVSEWYYENFYWNLHSLEVLAKKRVND